MPECWVSLLAWKKCSTEVIMEKAMASHRQSMMANLNLMIRLSKTCGYGSILACNAASAVVNS